MTLQKYFLGSKSKSLSNLRNVKSAKNSKFITVDEYGISKLKVELKDFSNQIIVRSDSDSEDSFQESSAGKFFINRTY